MPGTKLDQLAIVQVPSAELKGYKVVALDWSKDRQFVVVDFITMTKTCLDITLGGWVESIVGIPEENQALIVYRNEIVLLRV